MPLKKQNSESLPYPFDNIIIVEGVLQFYFYNDSFALYADLLDKNNMGINGACVSEVAVGRVLENDTVCIEDDFGRQSLPINRAVNLFVC